MSGTKRSKTITAAEKKDHAALWEYIVKNYGRTPTNAMYKSLAKVFGLKVGSDVSGTEKNAILNKLKEYGLKRGTKRVAGVPAWMDEEGLGSEMVISRADNAVLTRIPAGSSVVPANLTDNLWKWGEFSPSQMMGGMLRAQAALDAELAGVASMNSLNRRLMTGGPDIRTTPPTIGGEILEQMLALMSRYLPEIETTKDVYIDGEKVSAATSSADSINMAMKQRRIRK
jgi:hypothetical protein